MKFKAEDWLTDSDLHQKNMKYAQDKGKQIDEKEVQLAQRVLVFFRSLQVSSISLLAKDELRRKLEISLQVERNNSSKNWFRWAAAAVLVIGLSAGWLFYQSSDSRIEQFADHLDEQNAGENTTLILGMEKEILIAEKESKISYESGGKRIEINQQQQVEVFGDSVQQTFHSVVVPYGKRSQIELSDGTKVWLNSGTKFVFPSFFNTNKREVYLQGEAIFEVAHLSHSSFHVRTDDFSVKVLGTVFNISAYADDESSSAVLASGKIEIINKRIFLADRSFVMDPGAMVVYNSAEQSFASSKVNPDEYLSWRNGYLSLQKRKLADIVKKLSRYYNREIAIQDPTLAQETFTGLLDLKNSPHDVLEVISRMVPLSLEETNDGLIVRSKETD